MNGVGAFVLGIGASFLVGAMIRQAVQESVAAERRRVVRPAEEPQLAGWVRHDPAQYKPHPTFLPRVGELRQTGSSRYLDTRAALPANINRTARRVRPLPYT